MPEPVDATSSDSPAELFVKICGVTCPEDAVAAVRAGADAVGCNFVPGSVRRISLEVAAEIVAAVPAGVMTVGVFRDAPVGEVLEVVTALGLTAAQLHGDTPPAHTAAVAEGVGTVIKVVTAGSPAVGAVAAHGADIVMVDAPSPGGGVTFDWRLVEGLSSAHRLLLAGGLHPGNVAEAIRRVQPWGVDVATGVESAPGRKDAALMARFVAAARSATG